MPRLIPPVFDVEFYKSIHADLASMSRREAEAHYNKYGKHEGRACSPGQLRENFIELIDPSASALEIGPFHAPVLRGPNAFYFDVNDEEGLAHRARMHGLPTDDIPHINFVSETGDLGVIDRTFEQVFSSHCIEHQPDLIGHLKGVSRILGDNQDGRLYMLIPDKRFCFDHFMTESNITDVLGAHVDGRRLHTSSAIIAHHCLTTHNDPGRHWAGDHGSPAFLQTPETLATGYAAAQQSLGVYVDTHAWRFTPDSFATIIDALNSLHLIDLEVERVFNTPFNRLEFAAVLRKAAPL
jgi:hypothetical protein